MERGSCRSSSFNCSTPGVRKDPLTLEGRRRLSSILLAELGSWAWPNAIVACRSTAAVAAVPAEGAILLPGSTLPLTVFEPRYLAMVDDVIAGARILGIIQPAGDQQGKRSPGAKLCRFAVWAAPGAAAYRELIDGRLSIVLTGLSRFDIVGEAGSGMAYRIASVGYDRFASILRAGSVRTRLIARRSCRRCAIISTAMSSRPTDP